MGKFDGILLCTDFDHTLAIKAVVSQENADAIRYFQENGGRFTVVSGRNPFFLKEHIEGFAVNAPLVGYNGALIIDETTDEILFSGGRNDLDAFDLVEAAWEKEPTMWSVTPHDASLFVGRCSRTLGAEGAVADMATLRALLTKRPLYNVICSFKAEEDAIAVKERLAEAAGDKFIVIRSWATGVEVINPWDQKGAAALRLKELLGAKLLVCAGDFENDISMIEAADIGYAVENALPSVKAAADRVTVSCEQHAIAAIIRELDETL